MRLRVGRRAPADAVFALVVMACGVGIALLLHRRNGGSGVVSGSVVVLLGVYLLAHALSALRAVRVEGDRTLVLSVPTFSVRRGPRRWVRPLAEITVVEMSGRRGRQPTYRCARIVAGSDEVFAESITCPGGVRHPSRTPAGRAVAEIRELIRSASVR